MDEPPRRRERLDDPVVHKVQDAPDERRRRLVLGRELTVGDEKVLVVRFSDVARDLVEPVLVMVGGGVEKEGRAADEEWDQGEGVAWSEWV